MKGCNFSKVLSSVCNGLSVVANYNYHKGGRILVIWMPNKFTLNIIGCHAQYIHCQVCHLASGKYFHVTFVYGLMVLMKDQINCGLVLEEFVAKCRVLGLLEETSIMF